MHSWNPGGIMISIYAAIPTLQKHNKFERMSGYNCSFIIEKGLFNEWMAVTGLANYLNTIENRDDC